MLEGWRRSFPGPQFEDEDEDENEEDAYVTEMTL
jgi:hypothetical protein